MERLYLHIGLMKTGTTYLQSLWRANAGALAAQGVWFPSGRADPAVSLAVWDLVGRRPRGAPDGRVHGQWEALTEAVASRAHQRVLLSEEYLAARSPREAARAVAGFPRHEVHIVVTVRDLGRVLVSTWQENVKSGSTHTWADFIAAVADPTARTRDPARGFWLRQDLPHVLEVWGAAAGRERVHVVTLPPATSPGSLLLERMGSLIGFDPSLLTEPADRSNESIGAPATEVVRRMNERLGGRLNQRQYDRVVKRTVQAAYSAVPAPDRVVLPTRHLEWAGEEAERMVAFVREGGFDVVGDLDDLVPVALGGRTPEQVTDAELLESSLQALSVLAEQTAGSWWVRRRADRRAVPPSSRFARASSRARGAAYRTRRKGAELADRNRVAALAMRGYLWLRARRR